MKNTFYLYFIILLGISFILGSGGGGGSGGESGETPTLTTYYFDYDTDGYGDPRFSDEASTQPSDYVENDDDCDDDNSNINPEATEICDGIDNDCDGEIDEDCEIKTYYLDFDADEYGNPDESVEAYEKPQGYVIDSSDCNDTDATINPGVEEICNDGKDNNCNGEENEGFNEECQKILIIKANEDTYANEHNSGVNYNYTKLLATGDRDEYYRLANQVSFVKFDLTIPNGMRIIKADLSITGISYSWTFTGRTWIKQIENENWTENTLNYNNMPTSHTRYVVKEIENYDSETISFDITAIVTGWYEGDPNYGVIINTTDISTGGFCIFYSRERYNDLKYGPTLTILCEEIP